MTWLVFTCALTAVGAGGVVIDVNQLRWQHRVARMVRALRSRESAAASAAAAALRNSEPRPSSGARHE
jgi:hypothetical protein